MCLVFQLCLLFYFFPQYCKTQMKNNIKSTQLPISVLNMVPRNLLTQTPSPSFEYELYHVANKKICIEAYKTFVPKTKLFTNLQIYQWRSHTQFPISKTKYVSIQPNVHHSPMQQGIELLVYIQHCPLKLNRMYEMTLAQTVYMLKESYIGFERLYNRFGPFQITENMIAINQKGYCKVWLNQNYAINTIFKAASSQEAMIYMIQSVMQSHCQQSKASRKLFDKLKNCKTFLSAIKQVDWFAIGSKLLVPSRFILSASSCKQIPCRLDTFNPLDKGFTAACVSQQNIRYSIFSSKNKINQNQVKQQIVFQNQNSQSKGIQNQIKRFKSLSRIKAANIMKISDGQTAYTRNNNTKASNLGAFHNSPRETTNEKTTRELSKNRQRKWLQDSTFVMQLEDAVKDKKQAKQKKQMSYSTSLMNKPQSCSLKNRKFSANVCTQKLQNSYYKFHNQTSVKKSQYNNDLQNQFALVIDDQQKQKDNSACTPRIKIVQEDDEQKYKEEHTQNILKNNGWNLNAFLTVPKQLNESFHEGGHEQNNLLKQIKLQKLDNIGRRPVAMSVLPEQYQDII